jgi:DNA-binding MarR family transcriptional regulator
MNRMPARRRSSSLQRDAAALFEAARAYNRFYQFRDRDTVLRSGLTVVQSYALGILISGDGATLTGLARGLQLDKSTTSRVVKGMTKHDLVEWSRGEHDQRTKHIIASPEGKRRYGRHRRSIERDNARLLASYPPAARRAIITALRQLTRRAGAGPSNDSSRGGIWK